MMGVVTQFLAAQSTPTYEGLVATRAGMLFSTGGFAKIMSRSSHVAVTDISSLKIGWANTYYDGNGNVETTPTVNSTLIASIEYPSGQFTQLKWGGNTSITVSPLTYVESDYGTPQATIPIGATFWIRIYNVSAGSNCVGVAKNRNAGMGDLCNTNASTDQTMGGTISNSGTNWSPPAAIIGQTNKPSTIVPGDSTDYAPIDESTNLVDDFRRGKVCHGFPLQFAFLNHGNSGATISGFLAGSTCRRQMWKYASHAIIGLGRNDLDAGDSAATIISNIQSIIIPQFTRPGGCRILFATTLPKSSSSSGFYLSGADQTTNGNNAARVTLCTAARNGTISGVSGFIETALSMEPVLDNGLWIGDATIHNVNTSDGIHGTAAGYVTMGAYIASEIISKIHYP